MTCFDLIRSHSDVHTGWIHGTGTHDLARNGWTRRSHQLGRQIACGATVRSEANEKIDVKAKAMTKVPLELNNKRDKPRRL